MYTNVPVTPRTNYTLDRTIKRPNEARDGVCVRIQPSTDSKHGTPNSTLVLTYAAVSPIIVQILVRKPFREQQWRLLQPRQPHLLPLTPNQLCESNNKTIRKMPGTVMNCLQTWIRRAASAFQ